MATFTPITIAGKEAFENAETGKNGENTNNGDKNKNLETNFA